MMTTLKAEIWMDCKGIIQKQLTMDALFQNPIDF